MAVDLHETDPAFIHVGMYQDFRSWSLETLNSDAIRSTEGSRGYVALMANIVRMKDSKSTRKMLGVARVDHAHIG